MSIEITQTCDGHRCPESRTLDRADSLDAAGAGGWREVGHDRWLCPACVNRALTGRRSADES